MNVLREQMQTLISRLSQPTVTPMLHVTQVQPVKARLDPSGLPDVDKCVAQTVPGDGDCLWHACYAWQATEGPNPQAVAGGVAYKQRVLHALRTQTQMFAQAWGCEAQGILSACETWSSDWADARALLTVSVLEGAYIILLNRRDNVVEVIGPRPWVPGSVTRCWLLEFGSDHYNPSLPPSAQWMMQVLAAAQFEPWKTPVTSGALLPGGATFPQLRVSPPPRGLATGDPAQMEARWFDQAVKDWHISPSTSQSLLHTCNVTSWRTNMQRLLPLLDNQGSHIVCLQETGTSIEQQRSATAMMNRANFHVVWGQATPRVRKRTRGWMLDRSSVPGVAILHSAHLQVYPCDPRTLKAKSLVQQGRLIMAWVKTREQQPYYIMNVYLPAGANEAARKLEMQHTIFEEVLSWASIPGIVCGDFNQRVEGSPLLASLSPLGWRLPLHVSQDGTPQDFTYQSGSVQTKIDDMIFHPSLHAMADVLVISQLEGLQHCLLTTKCHTLEHEEIVPVRYPPHLDIQAKSPTVSPICWQSVEKRARRAYEHVLRDSQTREWAYLQDQVDKQWCEFQDILQRHLLSCYGHAEDTQAKRMPYGHDWKRAPVKPKIWNPERLANNTELGQLRRDLRRLTSLKPFGPHASIENRLRHHRDRIMGQLGLSSAQFQDALSNPDRWVSHWSARIKILEQREHKRQVHCWHRKLTTRGHRPTRALFKWVKQGPRRGHFTLKHEEKILSGPSHYFDAHRTYWAQLMNRDPQEVTDTHKIVGQLPPTETPTPYDFEQSVLLLQDALGKLTPWAASGLDMWPPEALKAIPLPAIRALAWLYYSCEVAGCWPRSMLSIRVQVIPKTDDPMPPVQDHRPISVTSVWYRAWAAWALRRLPSHVWDNIGPTACGGLPKRTPFPQLLEVMLAMEAALINPLEHPWVGVVSLDAVKCFDLLAYPCVLKASLQLGIPTGILRLLSEFWLHSTRYISAHSCIETVGFRSNNGIPQGCAMSIIMCVAMVCQWTATVEVPRVRSLSYVDDRYLLSEHREAILEAWQASQQWHKGAKWKINPQKSCVVQVGGPKIAVQHDGDLLPSSQSLKALGTETPVVFNQACQLQRKRFQNARAMVDRLSLLRLPVHVVQHLLAVCVIPKAIYALVPRLPPLSEVRSLTQAIKKAMGVWRRRGSWDLSCACIGQPHVQDPMSAAMYAHALTVIRARRARPVLNQLWTRMDDNYRVAS